MLTSKSYCGSTFYQAIQQLWMFPHGNIMDITYKSHFYWKTDTVTWGYKMGVLSVFSGSSYNFELFAGRYGYSTEENDPNLEAASNLVVRICRPIPPNGRHKLYYDNYFSGMPKPQAIWLFEYVDQYHLMDVTNSIMTITSLPLRSNNRAGPFNSNNLPFAAVAFEQPSGAYHATAIAEQPFNSNNLPFAAVAFEQPSGAYHATAIAEQRGTFCRRCPTV
ncbi:hypothetical protein QE152_g35341 [Popillia japonica]|uniref:PiggyBac transposable element-derived protein domain-containing protein n=1 Tax=Popillia japonica TaxID=7064 RepID=A0AAW1IF88_POPJA